jgi:phospholipid/cholesterol/gamma-HCH transport system substrate-binding protein
LLGGAFLSIEPGSSESMIAAGGEFQYAQGSIDLLTLFSQAVGGGSKEP